MGSFAGNKNILWLIVAIAVAVVLISSCTMVLIKLKKGKKLKLKTALTPVSKKLKVRRHVGVRYESSNPGVATVTSKGRITARGKGKCNIYVYAQNGAYKIVKTTIR